MKNYKCFIKQYPHGFNDGFEYHDGKAPTLTTSSCGFNNFVILYEDMQNFEIIPILRIKEATKAGFVEIHPGQCFDAENPNSETRRGRKMDTKSNCLMAKDTDFMRYEGPRIIELNGRKVRVLGIRRLTPTECSRLQTIPTWYRLECSDSQAYRMLGNGWTVEVIKHFFQFLPFEKEA